MSAPLPILDRAEGYRTVPEYRLGDGLKVSPTADLKFVAGKLHQRFTCTFDGTDAGWFPVPSE